MRIVTIEGEALRSGCTASTTTLFSVDWPYESNMLGCAWIDSLPLSNEDKEKLAHKNAERVLRL